MSLFQHLNAFTGVYMCIVCAMQARQAPFYDCHDILHLYVVCALQWGVLWRGNAIAHAFVSWWCHVIPLAALVVPLLRVGCCVYAMHAPPLSFLYFSIFVSWCIVTEGVCGSAI